MRYIVSGYRRSGTSMMMQVMATLLMPEVKIIMTPELEGMNQKIDDYQPNPFGLLETGQNLYMQPEWLRKNLVDNRLIKIFFDGLLQLPAHDEPAYTILFMNRSPKEIQQSLRQVAEYFKKIGRQDIPTGRYAFNTYDRYNQNNIDHVIGIMQVRSDVNLVEFQYEHFVQNPGMYLMNLITKIPAKISKEKFQAACDVVNPEYRRARCA